MSNKLTKEEFIEKAKGVHGDKYDYSKAEYLGYTKKIEILCPDHGSFFVTPHTHLKGVRCKKCWDKIKADRKRKTLEDFIKEAKEKHGDKFDYSKAKYINTDTKIKITCPIHGEFEQTPYQHLKGKTGCIKCGIEERASQCRGTKENFIQKAEEVHGKRYDYSKVEYINNNTDVCIICPEHGEFWQRPANHTFGRGCPKCVLPTQYKGDYPEEFSKRSATLYMLEFTSEDEKFFKVGVTSNPLLKGRLYSFPKEYSIKILYEVRIPMDEAFGLEKFLLESMVDYEYIPNIYFGGHTECLSMSPLEFYKELLEE